MKRDNEAHTIKEVPRTKISMNEGGEEATYCT